jgi:hypothetical protein
LSASFANGVRINGIIYLHRISDNRVGGTSARNLRMFKALSGADSWPNTAIGTTMWKTNERLLSEKREAELAGGEEYFADLLEHGARLFRVAEHGNGVDEQKHAALRMVSHLVQQTQTLPYIELDIQRELVSAHRPLDETAAGKETLGDLYHVRRQLTLDMQNAQRDMQEAVKKRDLETVQQLQSLEQDCIEKLRKSEKQQKELKTSLMEMHDAEVELLRIKLDDIEALQRDVLATKRQELKDMEDALEAMTGQSARDAATRQAQALGIAVIEKNRLVSEQMGRECRQEVVKLRKQVAKEEKQLASVHQGKQALRHNVINGASNGVMTAMTTVVGTMRKWYSHPPYNLRGTDDILSTRRIVHRTVTSY